MIEIINNNLFKNIFQKIKSNVKYITYFVIVIISISIILQIYYFQQNKKILKLSILYDQAMTNLDSEEFNEKMNIIAKENNIFGILASLELIKNNLINKKFNESYNDYLNLLNERNSGHIYQSIIALHGSYNLLDYVSNDKIEILLSYVDENLDEFISYRYEILFLLSTKYSNKKEREDLYNNILKNEKISKTIKDRIKKINEFEKYK